ncbi:TolC family outer membrane protein [Methylotenera versatilis]|uniref:TolC family outer membrane protein n=2 Tax=Methylotenera TaxID=359407 RepID=UPI000375FDD2|nr:TolC family outer membrane protein [Methylotenera versatilis]
MNTTNALSMQAGSHVGKIIVKNKMLLKSLLMVTVVNTLLISSATGTEQVGTLKQMVEKTISSNPEVQSRYHAYLGAGYETDVVKGGFLPKVDIQSTYRRQEDINSIRSATGTEIPRWNNELVLRQMIFDGFATPSEVNRLGHAKRVRYYELQASMQDTTLEFMRAYIDTLRFRQLAEYAKTNYVTHKQLFDKIKERVDAGVARRVDLEQATGRLALAEANLLTEMTNLHDVTARVQRLLGELPPETLEQPDFYSTGKQATPVEALRVAYLQNPNLLSTIEDIQATKDEVKTKEGKFLPRLDLQARKNLGTSSDGRNSTNAADVLELTMNFNLFNGFSDKASVSQTIEKLNTANDFRDKACVDTRQLVTIAYNDINQLKEQLTYRDIHQKSIEMAREAYRKQFDIGQRTLLDLLDTENEYFQARRSYANADYDVQTAYARLYASQGELLNKIGSARQGLPEVTREAYMDAANICEAIAPAQVTVDKVALLADAKPLTVSAQLIKPVISKSALSCSTEVITGRVNDWAKSWRQKDYDRYSKFYADKFAPEPPLTRDEWAKQRKERLSILGKINLDLTNVQVSCDGDKAVAKFDQDYSVTTYQLQKPKSSSSCQVCDAKRIANKSFSDKVNKELQFEKVGSQYQIVRELVN